MQLSISLNWSAVTCMKRNDFNPSCTSSPMPPTPQKKKNSPNNYITYYPIPPPPPTHTPHKKTCFHLTVIKNMSPTFSLSHTHNHTHMGNKNDLLHSRDLCCLNMSKVHNLVQRAELYPQVKGSCFRNISLLLSLLHFNSIEQLSYTMWLKRISVCVCVICVCARVRTCVCMHVHVWVGERERQRKCVRVCV